MKTMYRIVSAGIFACSTSLLLTAATEPGIIWETKHLKADLMTLNDVASNGSGRLVAVGTKGTIRVSNNQGASWTTKNANVMHDLNSITWTGSHWVAVGGFSRDLCLILISTDGEEWTTTCLSGRPTLQAVAASPSITLAVGDLELTAHSSELIAWSTTTGSTASCRDVVWTGSQFVAIGSRGLVKTSPDGTTWTRRSIGLTTSMDLKSITWNESTLVAAGIDNSSDRPLLLTSTDGVIWAAPSMPVEYPDIAIEAIAWTGFRFVAMGATGRALTSPDGTVWSHHLTPGTISVRGMCWDGSRLIAVGNNGGILFSMSATPDETSDWTVSSYMDPASHLNDIATGELSGVTRTVVVGAAGTVLSSDDELHNITSRTSGISNTLNGICITTLPTTRFIAVGSVGTIITSADAVTWTPQTSGTTEVLHAAAWFKPLTLGVSRAIAVGNLGTILSSKNTTTWTTRTSGTSEPLRDLAVGTILVGKPPVATKRIVTVGYNGTILYSSNGINWTPAADSDTSQHLFGVAARDFGFVAVGNSGVILTSPDGSVWTKQTNTSIEVLYNLVWSGSQWVATGRVGTILTSSNGTRWTRRYGAGATSLKSVTLLDSGRLAAVGLSGLIITSDPSNDFTDWITSQSPPPGQDRPDDDPNGDGISNLIAYALGAPAVDPSDAESFAALPQLIQPAPGRPMILRMRPADSPLGDIAYIIETSTALLPGTWTEVLRHLPGQACGSGSIDIMMSAASNDVFLIFPESIGEHERFFARLRIEQLP